MQDWLNIGKAAIFRDKSKNGLLFSFLKEYKEEFGGSINPNCGGCRAEYWDKYLKSLKMEVKNEHGFTLKLKYNGIFLDSKPYRNADLTEAGAIKLIENHPHGKDLFESIPKSYYKVKEVVVDIVAKAKRKTKRKFKKN